MMKNKKEILEEVIMKKKITNNIIYFSRAIDGRLESDVLDTYNFLKEHDESLAKEYWRKAKSAEKRFKKRIQEKEDEEKRLSLTQSRDTTTTTVNLGEMSWKLNDVNSKKSFFKRIFNL